MTTAFAHGRARRSNYRSRRLWEEAAALIFAVVVLIWTLTPIYNMIAVALEAHGDVFTNDLFPSKGCVALVSARSPQHRQDDRGRIPQPCRRSNSADVAPVERVRLELIK